MNRLIIAIIGIFVCCSCSKNDDPEPTPEPPVYGQTVLVYMAAENNLYSFAKSDLEEMKEGSKKLTENNKLIVYVDEANSDRTPFLARVKNGELIDTVYMAETLTADPEVLETVLRTTKEKYPSKSYGLLLWGHASGWLISNDSVEYHQSRAYGGDNGYNTSTSMGRYWMNIPSMAKAIGNGMGNDRLRFIMGDCCNFGCIEIAYELRNVTDYVIGSPAEIPDDGAPYNIIVPDLFDDSDLFYRRVIDDYYNFYLSELENNIYRYYNFQPGDLKGFSIPLVAINTYGLENLAYATAQILSTIASKLTPDNPLDLSQITYYGQYGSYNYAYDMQQVLKNHTDDAAYNQWLDSFNQACPYHSYSQKWLTGYPSLARAMDNFDTNGNDCASISMFFPLNKYSYTSPNWNNAIKKYQWNQVIRWEQYGW